MLSRKQRLSQWISMTMIIVFVVCAFVCFAHNFWNPDQYPTDAAVRVSKWQATVFLSVVAVLEVMMLSTKVLERSRMSPLNVMLYMESAATVLGLLMMLMTIGISRHYLATMSGYDNPEVVWGRDLGYVDGLNLLIMNFSVSCVHLAPVRWLSCLPLEVGLVVVFELPVYVWGSPAPEAVPFFSICAVGLAVLAAAGKRQSELQDRLLFKGLLAEKKLRFEAEHELAMQQDSTTASSRRGTLTEGSAIGSRPETTSTALAFEMDQSGSLAEMRAVGVREQWLIDSTEVKALPGRVLGTGGFGVVVEGLYHNTTVALKELRQDIQMNLVHARLLALCNELRILRRLRHPNVVFLYGATMDEHRASCDSASCAPLAFPPMRLCLVLEHIDGVLLKHFMRPPEAAGGESGGGTLTDPPRSSTATINDRTRIVFDILNALRYLHSRTPPVVHGDLTESNISVQQLCLNGVTVARAKLLDFGLARLLTRSAKPLGGTTRWRAPELFEKDRVRPDRAADVYSVGLLIFFIATGTPPFQDVHTKEITRRRVRKRPLFLSWPDGRGDLHGLQCWCAASVERCTQVWPENRPSVEDVCDELARGVDVLGRADAHEEDGPADLRRTDTEPRADGAPDPWPAPVPEGACGRGAAALAPPTRCAL